MHMGQNIDGSDDDPHHVGPLLERSPTIGRGHGMGGTCGTWAPSANPPHTHTRIPSPSVISKFHSRVCFDRAQLLAICKPPISSTTNRTATEVGRSTDGWRIFSIKSRLSTPFPRELSSQPTFQIGQLRSFRSPPSSVCEVHSRVSISKSRAISASLESNSAMSVTGLSVRLSPPMMT